MLDIVLHRTNKTAAAAIAVMVYGNTIRFPVNKDCFSESKCIRQNVCVALLYTFHFSIESFGSNSIQFESTVGFSSAR